MARTSPEIQTYELSPFHVLNDCHSDCQESPCGHIYECRHAKKCPECGGRLDLYRSYDRIYLGNYENVVKMLPPLSKRHSPNCSDYE